MENDNEAWRAECSAEYLAAYDASNIAIRAFRKAQDDYRAQIIGDAAYLAARANYNAACAEYDAAYAVEQAR